MCKDTNKEYLRVFHENIFKRSRTAKGISDTSSSEQKKELVKNGEELEKQNTQNIERAIRLILKDNCASLNTPENLRLFSEHLHDVITDGLQDADAYKEQFIALKKETERLRMKTGFPYHADPRYRMWDVSYTLTKPVDIGLGMIYFYEKLCFLAKEAKDGRVSQALLLAYTDYQLDNAIHPWADGCGRHATAMVMYISLLKKDFLLPVFGSREEHYKAIQKYETHEEYFKKCLKLKNV